MSNDPLSLGWKYLSRGTKNEIETRLVAVSDEEAALAAQMEDLEVRILRLGRGETQPTDAEYMAGLSAWRHAKNRMKNVLRAKRVLSRELSRRSKT